jgi:hypothetical protein
LRRFWSSTVVACLLWACCGAYAAGFVYRGWIPHDEGTIGQSAERVLAGEMPHRDFDDPYTGGLAFLHAAGMRVLGVSLRTPRLIVFGFFLAFLAAVYGIARRIASPAAACVAMVMATVWSIPNYFVSLPSWYNLFFAAFGTLALLRYLDTGRRRWLVLAGACGGLSLLAKITGLFSLAAGVLFLVYVEQTTAPVPAGERAPQRSGFWPIASIPALVLIAATATLSRSVPPELLQLFVPALIVCMFLAWQEWSRGRGTLRQRGARLAALLWPFAVGASIPVGAFVLLFWQQHGLAELIRGVLILPQRRLAEASATPPSIATLGLAVPYVILLLAGRERAIPREWLIAAGLMALFGIAIALGGRPPVYQAMWAVTRAMPLAIAAAGVALIAQLRASTIGGDVRPVQRVFLVVTMAAVVVLVQFPYATPIYFCYAAPMTLLAIVAVIYARPQAPRRIHLALAAFLFLFAVVFINRTYAWNLGVRDIPFNPTGLLDTGRGALRVSATDASTYTDVVNLVRRHAAGGTIYAGPDCPEVYFLSGFSNPTRAFFEFLSPVQMDAQAMADLLARSPIRAAVINTTPEFSPRLDAGALAVLERRFPVAERIGKFVVRFE